MQLKFCHEKGVYKYDENMTKIWWKYEVINFLENYAIYINKLTFIIIIHHSMAIVLNVGIVLIRSDTTYSNKCRTPTHCLNTRAYCLLNTCKVLESSQQVF